MLKDDANDADDMFVETPVYDTTAQAYTFNTGIITGHSYRVKLRLCSVVGCSPESQIVGPMVAASPPSAPMPVYAVSSSNTQLSIAWRFPGSNGGSPILGWRVRVSQDGETWPADPSYTINSVDIMTQAITCGDFGRDMEALWVRTTAVSIIGEGDASNTLTARCSAVLLLLLLIRMYIYIYIHMYVCMYVCM